MKLFCKLFRTEADFPAPRYPDRKSRVELLTLGVFALMLVLAAVLLRVFSGQEARLQASINAQFAEAEEQRAQPPQNTSIGAFEWIKLDFANTGRGELMLVNRAHLLTPNEGDEDRLKKLLELTGEDYFVSDWNVRLDEHAARALEKAMADARKAGVPRSILADRAYRTPEDQAWLCREYYDLKEGEHLAAPMEEVLTVCAPNASDYQTGFSVHLSIFGGGELDQSPHEQAVKKAMEQAGFCLRYPKEKESKTLVKGNAGQFRFVGRVHAAYMAEKNLCLEEYIAALQEAEKEQNALHMQADGKAYCVYRVTAAEGLTSVPVPEAHPYTLSGDNCGGIIVTVCLEE